MPFWNIKGFKIVVVQVHFPTLHHFKTKMRKNIDNFFESLSERMLLPERNLPARKRDIDALFFQTLSSLSLLNLQKGVFNPLLKIFFNLICPFACPFTN